MDMLQDLPGNPIGKNASRVRTFREDGEYLDSDADSHFKGGGAGDTEEQATLVMQDRGWAGSLCSYQSTSREAKTDVKRHVMSKHVVEGGEDSDVVLYFNVAGDTQEQVTLVRQDRGLVCPLSSYQSTSTAERTDVKRHGVSKHGFDQTQGLARGEQ